jgi:hypothetical protein
MTKSTRTLAEILHSVPLEDAEQISEFQGTVYMPLYFLEKYLLPTMQMRKLIEPEGLTPSGSESLPGGPETAISCLVLFCLPLHCLLLPCLALSCLTCSCIVLSYFVLFCLVLSCLVVSCCQKDDRTGEITRLASA